MKHLLFIVFVLLSLGGHSQDTASCAALKEGVFYFYPKNSNSKYALYRNKDEQKEVNLENGDSTIWSIKWINDCTYILKFKSTSNKKISAEEKELNSKHKFVYSITKTGKGFYIFRGTIDKVNNQVILEDTMWMNEKTQPQNSELFKLIKSERDIHRLRETSHYAILYIYRPHKLANGLGSYLIYFDNVPMCVMENNSGFVFKILKEGTFPITSRLLNDEAAAKVEFKFGNTYYVKAGIRWTITKKLNNFKLEMEQMSNEKGEAEFERIKNR